MLEAKNGDEALIMIKQHTGPIALLLTYVVVPRMSGHHLAEQIAATRPEVNLLFMSGDTDDAVVQYGVFTAEVAFIQKPFTPDSFLRKVRELLDRPQRGFAPSSALKGRSGLNSP